MRTSSEKVAVEPEALNGGRFRIDARNIIKSGKRGLYFAHRWLGVMTCILCVIWFLSGLVMLYVPFPSWSDKERIENLPAIDIAQVNVLPDAALTKSATTGLPQVFRLEMLGPLPVYRIVQNGNPVTIAASTGQVMRDIDVAIAQQHIKAVFSRFQSYFKDIVDRDQWTVTRKFDSHRPMYRFDVDDGLGSIVYVSSRTGEIVQNATRSERGWNWLGAIPHWIYFTPIRRDQELWRQVVMWSSGPVVIGSLAGLWIGILRLRLRRRYAGKWITPYSGWMKWHHISGLVGGFFLVTWIFSGWLSVNPFQLFARTQLSQTQLTAYTGWNANSPLGVTSSALNAAATTGSTELVFTQLGGRSYIIANSPNVHRLYDATNGAPITLTNKQILSAVQALFPENKIVLVERQTTEDSYWYSLHQKRPLPVLKAAFDDHNATSIYLDPSTGNIAGLSDRSGRTYRWLFNFFHSYDLPILLGHWPSRDIVIWLLSLAGLVVSVSGVVIGVRVLFSR